MKKREKELASRLRHRVTLQSATLSADEGGGYTHAWEEVATLWAELKPLSNRSSGLERMNNGQLEARTLYLISLRYRDDITADMRVSYGSRVFNIRSIVNVEERDEELQLLAEEGVAT